MPPVLVQPAPKPSELDDFLQKCLEYRAFLDEEQNKMKITYEEAQARKNVAIHLSIIAVIIKNDISKFKEVIPTLSPMLQALKDFNTDGDPKVQYIPCYEKMMGAISNLQSTGVISEDKVVQQVLSKILSTTHDFKNFSKQIEEFKQEQARVRDQEIQKAKEEGAASAQAKIDSLQGVLKALKAEKEALEQQLKETPKEPLDSRPQLKPPEGSGEKGKAKNDKKTKDGKNKDVGGGSSSSPLLSPGDGGGGSKKGKNRFLKTPLFHPKIQEFRTECSSYIRSLENSEDPIEIQKKLIAETLLEASSMCADPLGAPAQINAARNFQEIIRILQKNGVTKKEDGETNVNKLFLPFFMERTTYSHSNEIPSEQQIMEQLTRVASRFDDQIVVLLRLQTMLDLQKKETEIVEKEKLLQTLQQQQEEALKRQVVAGAEKNEEKIRQLEERLRELSLKNSELEGKNRQLGGEIAKQKSKILGLEEKLNSAIQERSTQETTFRATNTELEKKLSEKQQEILRLTETLKVAPDRNEVERKLQELKALVAQLEKEKAAIAADKERELSEKEQIIQKLQGELQTLQETLKQQSAEHRQVLQTQNTLLAELKVQLASAGTATEDVRAELVSTKEVLEQVQRQLQEKQGALELSQEQLSAAQAALTQKQAQLDEAQAALALNREELKETQAALARNREELKETQAALAQNQAQLGEAQAALARNREELGATQKELAGVKRELAGAQQKVSELEEQLSELQKTAEEGGEEKDEKIRKLTKKLAKYKNEKIKFEEQSNSLNQQLAAQGQENSGIAARLEELTRQNEELISRLTEAEINLQKSLAEQEQLKAALTAAQAEIEKQKQALADNKENSSAALTAKEEALTAKEEALAAAQTELADNKENSAAALAVARETFDAAQIKLTEENQRLQEALVAAEQKFAAREQALNEELTRLRQELEKLKSAVEGGEQEKEAKIADLMSKQEEIVQEKEKLQQDNAALQVRLRSQQEDTSKISGRLEELIKENQRLQEALAAAQEQLAAAQRESAAAREESAAAREESAAAREESAAAREESAAAQKQLEEALAAAQKEVGTKETELAAEKERLQAQLAAAQEALAAAQKQLGEALAAAEQQYAAEKFQLAQEALIANEKNARLELRIEELEAMPPLQEGMQIRKRTPPGEKVELTDKDAPKEAEKEKQEKEKIFRTDFLKRPKKRIDPGATPEELSDDEAICKKAGALDGILQAWTDESKIPIIANYRNQPVFIRDRVNKGFENMSMGYLFKKGYLTTDALGDRDEYLTTIGIDAQKSRQIPNSDLAATAEAISLFNSIRRGLGDSEPGKLGIVIKEAIDKYETLDSSFLPPGIDQKFIYELKINQENREVIEQLVKLQHGKASNPIEFALADTLSRTSQSNKDNNLQIKVSFNEERLLKILDMFHANLAKELLKNPEEMDLEKIRSIHLQLTRPENYSQQLKELIKEHNKFTDELFRKLKSKQGVQGLQGLQDLQDLQNKQKTLANNIEKKLEAILASKAAAIADVPKFFPPPLPPPR